MSEYKSKLAPNECCCVLCRDNIPHDKKTILNRFVSWLKSKLSAAKEEGK